MAKKTSENKLLSISEDFEDFEQFLGELDTGDQDDGKSEKRSDIVYLGITGGGGCFS